MIEKLSNKVTKEEHVFVAHNATVIGDVHLSKHSSVWFNAVIRADNDRVFIGENSNIQDGSIIHVDKGFPVHIGREVTVGHAAIIHGATVGDNTLIGIRSTLLNGVKVGNWCIIGAHALLTEGTVIPDYSVVMGSPGKVVKTLSEEQKTGLKRSAENYTKLSASYLEF